MNDAERIWSEKSDEDLLEAAAELGQFTEDGRRIIRAELNRRSPYEGPSVSPARTMKRLGAEPM